MSSKALSRYLMKTEKRFELIRHAHIFSTIYRTSQNYKTSKRNKTEKWKPLTKFTLALILVEQVIDLGFSLIVTSIIANLGINFVLICLRIHKNLRK